MIDSSIDLLRNEMSAYWRKYKKSERFTKGSQLLYLADHPKIDDTIKGITDFSFSEEQDISSATMPFKQVSMRVYGNPTMFKNQRHWRAYFEGGEFDGKNYNPKISIGTQYNDNVFTCERPFTEREAQALGGTSLVKTYAVDLEYNFYQEDYEKALNRNVPENLLPNLYTLYSYKEEIDDESVRNTPIFRAHVSLNGKLHNNKVHQFTDKGSENPKASNSLQYLTSFARALTSRNKESGTHANIIEAYQNTILPPSNMDLLAYNVKKEMFPMFTEINFATDKTTQFTQILKDSSTSCIFMKDVAGSLQGTHNFPHTVRGYTTHVETPVMQENELGTKTLMNISRVATGNARIWDLNDWLKMFKASNAYPMQNSIMLGRTNEDAKMATTKNYGFYKKMMETIFVGKLRTLIKSQQRRFADIIDGDSSYSEEVFYRIDKYTQGYDAPIQTFWIPNTNEVDVMNYIDTQVKYSSEYTYKASVFKLVIGAQYSYSNLAITKKVTEECVEFVSTEGEPVAPRVPGSVTVSNISGTRTAIEVQNDQRYMAEFDVIVSPNIMLVEVPFFSVTSRMIDDPPLAPEIDILPYRSDSRFLKFFMQGSTGEEVIDPIIMTDKDRRMVQMIRKARNLEKNDPITYKSDDYPAYFEVYRLEEPPRTYRSFVGNVRASIATDISDKTKQKAAALAYIEQIAPNKKYYYMFRSVDVHGKIGYPSAVYEIEMLNDKGAFYPIIKLHEMNPRPARITKKTGRRFIQIIPNIGQTLINESKSGFEDYSSANDITGKLTYGFKAESIWDKKFKIRLTSKKTGRKLDLNLDFANKRVKTDFEESS